MTEKSNAARIERMREWADGVENTLTELRQGLVITTTSGSDAISARLGDLLDGRQKRGDDYHAGLVQRGELKVSIAEIKENIDVLEAKAMLDVSFEIGEKDKLKYSNDTLRKAAVVMQLDDNQVYETLREQKHEAERELARVGAMLEVFASETSDYNRAVDVLTAQLNNLTARVA
jgi:hypothetical protein